MLYPDAQPQDKSSGRGTSAKPKPKPIPALPAVIYTAFGIQEAEKLRERIEKAEEYRERVREAARKSGKPKNQERIKQDAAAQKRTPSIPAVIYTAFDKHKADELRERSEKVKGRSKPSLPDLQSFYTEPDWPASRPLTDGQKHHVDHLLSIEDDALARDMLIGIRRDGMPSPKYLNDYLAQFAEWGWDEISDERTLELLNTIRQSNWDAWLKQVDSAPVETAAQDLANNTIESLQVIDAATGQVLLSRVGVLGAGGGQSVGLQAEEVQTFQGRELIFVHNHPNGTAASDADLRTAFLAGAELLLVVTPRGYEYAYIRGEDGMALVREGDASYEVGPATAKEYVELTGRSWRQAAADSLNPPEYLMLQDEDEPNWWEGKDRLLMGDYELQRGEEITDVAKRMGVEEELLGGLNTEEQIASGLISIPLPGWSIDSGSFSHISDRTLFPRHRGYNVSAVVEWWEELTPTEQRIEMALTATASIGGRASFDNIQSFDSALNWIVDNHEFIHTYAGNARVPEEILKVILTSEILYDYAIIDAWQDNFVRHHIPLSIDIGWQGTGVANVHYATLIEAYHYIASRLPEGVEHPWDLDPNAPDLSDFPTLDLDEQAEQELKELPIGERDAEIFRQREERYRELTFDQKRAVAIYLVTNEGTINAASIVTGMYLDQYINQIWEDPQNFAEIAENLSPEDVARIWGRYRSSYEFIGSKEFGPNAQLALPIAEYFLD